MKTKILPLLVALSPITFIGCQSIEGLKDKSLFDSEPKALPSSHEQAKKELQKSLQARLKQSFDYQSHIKVSYLGGDKELALNERQKCERSHDQAYVELLQSVSKTDDYADEEQYQQQKEAIRDQYFACLENVKDNEKQLIAELIKEQEKENNELQEDAEELAVEATEDVVNGELEAVEADEEIEEQDQRDWQEVKDKKRSNDLFNAYLLKPLEVKISGRYQPLAGKFALAPSITYESRNLLFSQQLPIYIDLKSKNIYLWADFFANINAMGLDENLGTQWKDKWLKFSLQDDGLPEGFEKTLIKSYLKALETAYQQEPTNGFSYLPTQQLKSSIADIPDEHYSQMSSADHVIARIHSEAINDKQYYLIQKTLLDNIKKHYPNFATQIKNNKKLSLGNILYKYFEYVQKSIDRYELNNLDENGNLINNTDADKQQVFKKQYYGLSRSDKLNWTYTRYQENDKDLSVNIFTTLSKTKNDVFANLPEQSRIPNEQNSIDIRAYGKQLAEHYQQGGGTPLGKMGYKLFGKFASDPDSEETDDYQSDDEQGEEQISESEQEEYDSEDTTKIITIEPKTHTPIGIESANCVLLSLNVDMMCDDDKIDTSDPSVVKKCKAEQTIMRKASQEYCK